MTASLESLKQKLASADYVDRLKAGNQIRQFDQATAFDLLQIAIADANARVRYAAVSQMAGLDQFNAEQLLGLLRDRLQNDPEIDVKAAAADALGALRFQEALSDLQTAYHETDEWLLQFSIIAALGELGNPQAIPLLKEALSSQVELVQTAAIGSLGELGDAEVVPSLLPYVGHPDWQIRHRLVQALGRLGGEAAKAALETLSQDQAEQVASEARSLLASLT